MSPGVTNQSGQDEGGEGATTVAFSINGGRTEYNNFEIDGGDALDNGSNTTINVYPSIDAIAEVKVLTSNYGAQYGKNGSGTVEVETKSGTNQFHGDLYEFVRNDAFNATQFGLNFGPGIQEERLRLYHWRSGVYSRPLQHRQAEDILLLVGRMASRPDAGIKFLFPDDSSDHGEPHGGFQ